MKKIVKRPDGSEELLEGTAEEIAAYERALREQADKKPKKDVLKGAGLSELERLLALPAVWLGQERWQCPICANSSCNGSHIFL